MGKQGGGLGRLMAQVKLIRVDGTCKTVGMHAPKRPGELQKWYKAAKKALGKDASDWPEVGDAGRVDELFIIFGAPLTHGWIVIDRKAIALGM